MPWGPGATPALSWCLSVPRVPPSPCCPRLSPMGPRAGQAWGQRQAGLWGSVLLLGGLSIRVMVAGTLDRPRAPQQPSQPWSLGWGPARWAGARFLLGPQKELMDAKGRRASLCPAPPGGLQGSRGHQEHRPRDPPCVPECPEMGLGPGSTFQGAASAGTRSGPRLALSPGGWAPVWGRGGASD